MPDQLLTLCRQNMSPHQPLTKANLARLPRVSKFKRYMKSSELVDKHVILLGHPTYEQHRNNNNNINGENEVSNNVDDLDKYMWSLTEDNVVNDAQADVKNRVEM